MVNFLKVKFDSENLPKYHYFYFSWVRVVFVIVCQCVLEDTNYLNFLHGGRINLWFPTILDLIALNSISTLIPLFSNIYRMNIIHIRKYSIPSEGNSNRSKIGAAIIPSTPRNLTFLAILLVGIAILLLRSFSFVVRKCFG